MSDTYFTMLLEFETRIAREKSIEFLYDEGPVLKEEVEPEYQHLYFFADDFEEPEDATEIGDKKLLISYQIGYEGYLEAEELLTICSESKGLASVYAEFEDDETRRFFAGKPGIFREIHKITCDYDKDREINDFIMGAGPDEMLIRLAKWYETGKTS